MIERSLGYAREICEFLVRYISLCVSLSNSYYIRVCQACHSVLFSPRSCFLHPAFFHRIVHVVLLCSQKQMGRIAAGWIIAMMTYKQCFWEFSMLQKVCETMRFCFRHSPSVKITVALGVFARLPRPTFLRTALFHLAPKPNFDRLSLHKSVILICATLSALIKREGTFIFSHYGEPSTMN